MKTPMQELIEQLENWMLDEKEVQQNPTKYDYRDVKQANQLLKIKEQFLEMYKSMLEKEKEVIIETSKNSYIAGYLDNQAKIDDSMNFPNEYYNETFNTKEK